MGIWRLLLAAASNLLLPEGDATGKPPLALPGPALPLSLTSARWTSGQVRPGGSRAKPSEWEGEWPRLDVLLGAGAALRDFPESRGLGSWRPRDGAARFSPGAWLPGGRHAF